MHFVGDMRKPRSDCPDCADAYVDPVYAGLRCQKVVSIGKDSYINEQCGQPDLNVA